MVDLRPLTVGEILDRSASIWRANWKALFKLFLGFQLATWVLTKVWELISRHYFPAPRGGARTLEAMQENPTELLTQLGGSLSVGVGFAVVAIFGSYFVSVAATRYVFPRMIGKTATLTQALAATWKQVGALSGFYGLMILWTVLVAGLLVLPGSALILFGTMGETTQTGAVLAALGGVLALSGLMIAFLWFILRFMLAAQVLALEDSGAVGAFRRSSELSSGRIGPGFMGLTKVRLTIVFTVIATLFVAVTIAFSIPQMIVQFAYTNPFDPAHSNPDAVPAYLSVPVELLQVIAQSVIAPLMIVFDIVFYADMRVRREGLDLALKLEENRA